ncbi:WhiB family transcriptional regulator [Streptomyces sp. NPDC018972]|uniref:WhiB family transcriptional regulator n=1 Tax=Streptomyces sp. NPDC018972 TaxID=3365060 RepID=UPI003796C912
MEWLRSTACAGEDPELFFPVGPTGPAPRDLAAAERVRARRRVTAPCPPGFALDGGPAPGVRGDTGEDGRTAPLRGTTNDSRRRNSTP